MIRRQSAPGLMELGKFALGEGPRSLYFNLYTSTTFRRLASGRVSVFSTARRLAYQSYDGFMTLRMFSFMSNFVTARSVSLLIKHLSSTKRRIAISYDRLFTTARRLSSSTQYVGATLRLFSFVLGFLTKRFINKYLIHKTSTTRRLSSEMVYGFNVLRFLSISFKIWSGATFRGAAHLLIELVNKVRLLPKIKS